MKTTSKLKLVTIVGARPQFIKAATLSRVIAETADVDEVIIHTGQHYDPNMSDVFFEELSLPRPDHNLGIGGGSHGAMTGRQLEAIEKVLQSEMPDWVVVYGDTNSTLAGALAAAKLHIPVAHIEAGLRSFNRRMPEEINRVATDHVSDLLFAPTATAMKHLAAEGIDQRKAFLVGDVMYDAALYYKPKSREPLWFRELGIERLRFVLATVHRAENTDDFVRLTEILNGLKSSSLPVVLPIHPRTASRIKTTGLEFPKNITIVPPVGYLEMAWLEANCDIIATDSGGVQKEAYFHGKRCLVLRDETEWTELVDHNWVTLTGADRGRISAELASECRSGDNCSLYGLGDSAERIVHILKTI